MGGNIDLNSNSLDQVVDITMTGQIDGQGSALLNNFDEVNANVKNFDIVHPTKEGYRLRYSVLEGPEMGVYIRGKVTGDGVITLPDYWDALIVEDSITVQLTSIGSSCGHYVIMADRTSINIGCDCGDVNAYYIVHAERKYDKPLTVEYKVVK